MSKNCGGYYSSKKGLSRAGLTMSVCALGPSHQGSPHAIHLAGGYPGKVLLKCYTSMALTNTLAWG